MNMIRYALEVDRLLHMFQGHIKGPETLKAWDEQKEKVKNMTNEILNAL